MGNCLPFSKYIDQPEMKLRSSEDMDFNSKHLHSQSQSSFDFSNKDEIFFDSNDQAWLDSDVEDFQSVNSDSTPQIHDNNSVTSSQSDVLMAAETSSTSDMKKQLIDLFHDSFANDVDENKDIQQQQQTTTTTTTSTTTTKDPAAFYLPPKRKETTPNRTKPKSPQVSCCLPNLVRSLSSSSSEKKKK
ncbi:lisH domain-containing protein C1711.05-like [Euphorbia lathyris]|uniref:lisH domain-containing protein C1711.05-like n=1 Tax=Euphorbia lathyris TaxID=212925 RepID=UPI003313B662